MNVYGSEKADEIEILDFGKRLDLYKKYNLPILANPIGYAAPENKYFVVKRNGVVKILESSFGDAALKVLEKTDTDETKENSSEDSKINLLKSQLKDLNKEEKRILREQDMDSNVIKK